MKGWQTPWLAWLLYGLCGSALADGVQLEGFGTLSAYRNDDAVAAARPGERVKQASQAGHWRADGDTVLGLQLRWQSSDTLEWVWQVQARDELSRGYRPNTEWAYLGWQLDPEWTLRIGRQPLPIFLSSESTRVGFAHTSIRPMSAVYGLNSSEPVDGINASWTGTALGGNLSWDLGAGRNSLTVPTGRVDTHALLASALRWQREGLSLRLGVAAFRFDLISPSLETQLQALTDSQQVCANCSELLPQRARTSGVEGRLFNLALVWEHEDWTLTAEAMRRSGNSVFSPGVHAWYALLSRRYGRWTPYVAIGQSAYTESPLGLLAAAGSPESSAQRLADLDRSLQRPWDRRIELLGLRWDCFEKLALKLQVERWTATRDRSSPRDGEIRLLPNSAPWDGRLNMLTVSADFVF
ncbi:hypothetical protein [Roseateles sp.]|uniref:hypothetical protein n=1 Tax=Roseateles sp. TaxID=1971397 RepID=UPI003D127391